MGGLTIGDLLYEPSRPGDFTCMTTIGRGSTAKIAAACDDGTVRIYDSVTGVLRLSLRPEFPILEMTGLPDGSLLVCTHSGRPFITLWDIQTGGLVHTFILKGEAKRTTVSLKGRYLACETSKILSILGNGEQNEHPDPLEKFEGNMPCWLAPEELIMVVDWGRLSVYSKRRHQRSPSTQTRLVGLHSAVYSQVFDRLVIMSLLPRELLYHPRC
jgi:WD40 repeat protein